MFMVLLNKLLYFNPTYASSFDIITITEIRLSDYVYSNEILPNNFNKVCKDRDTRGGAVLLTINTLIPLSSYLHLPMQRWCQLNSN